MPLVINTNVGSLNAQRNLVKSGMEMSNAMERLSSGLRINTAADDAAGLAITNRMSSQVRGLDQAVRNANDGISMIATAEGALSETTNIMQRMRELAVQSSNGIYSDSDRATLNAEVEQLKEELDRIAETTSFNGQKILDGSQKSIDLQVGADSGQTINFGIDSFNTKQLGGSGGADVVGTESTGTAAIVAAVDGTDFFINGQSIGDMTSLATADQNVKGILDLVNSKVSGVEMSAFTEMTSDLKGDGILAGSEKLTIALVTAEGTALSYEIQNTSGMDDLVSKINDVTGGVVKASVNDDGTMTLANDEGAKITLTGSSSAVTLDATGFTEGTDNVGEASYALTSLDGSDIIISKDAAGTTALDTADASAFGLDSRLEAGDIKGVTATGVAKLGDGELVINGVEIGAATGATSAANVLAINRMSAQTGVVASQASDVFTLNSVDGSEISIEFLGTTSEKTTIEGKLGFQETNSAKGVGGSVADLDISTAAGAQKAIDTLDQALEQVNAQRSQLGAVNNRLDFTVSNLMNVSENTSAARSRILDADFAKETAALSKAQVLQQASSAMLAQANAAPQQVLSLLR